MLGKYKDRMKTSLIHIKWSGEETHYVKPASLQHAGREKRAALNTLVLFYEGIVRRILGERKNLMRRGA
jgi:hypothetical protein